MKSLKGYSVSGERHDSVNMKSDEDVSRRFRQAQEKYGDLDESALLQELKKQIEEQKRAGTYSAERMESYVQALKPYLSAEQNRRLSEILNNV